MSAAECAGSRRDGRGRFLTGNTAALKHGAYAEQERPELAAIVGNLDEFRAALTSDQGGESDLTTIRQGYVQRLVEAEALCRLLGADLRTRGIFTHRGRVRSTFGAFLAAVERWDRLAQRLGMERRQRDVGGDELQRYLEQAETASGFTSQSEQDREQP